MRPTPSVHSDASLPVDELVDPHTTLIGAEASPATLTAAEPPSAWPARWAAGWTPEQVGRQPRGQGRQLQCRRPVAQAGDARTNSNAAALRADGQSGTVPARRWARGARCTWPGGWPDRRSARSGGGGGARSLGAEDRLPVPGHREDPGRPGCVRRLRAGASTRPRSMVRREPSRRRMLEEHARAGSRSRREREAGCHRRSRTRWRRSERRVRRARPDLAGAGAGPRGDRASTCAKAAPQELYGLQLAARQHPALGGRDHQRRRSDRLPGGRATATTTTCRST